MNYYEEFNIDPFLSIKEIEDILNSEKRKWTMRVNAADLEKRQLAEKKVQLISKAEKVFKDEESKREYDQELKERQKKRPEPEARGGQGSGPSMDWQKANRIAADLVNQNKLKEALKYARMARDLDPMHPESWNLIGVIEVKLNRRTDAINSYLKASQLDPNNLIILNNLGFNYLILNRLSEARSMAERAMNLNNKDERTIHLMSRLLIAEASYDESIELLERGLKLHPDSLNLKQAISDAYKEKAFSYCHYDRARKAYFIVEGDNIESIIKNFEKANEYYPSKELKNNIDWAKEHSEKSFDAKNKKLFIIPAIMLLYVRGIIGISVVLLITYIIYKASIKTAWQKNREEIFGEDYTIKKAGSVVKDMASFTGEKLKETKKVVEEKIDEEKSKGEEARAEKEE